MSPDQDDRKLVEPAPQTASAGPKADAPPAGSGTSKSKRRGTNMLPEGRRRSAPERFFVRIIATAGIVGIGVAIGAIMTHGGSAGWMVGLVVAVVSVVLAAVLWSSRML